MKTKINEAITDVLKQFGDKYFLDDVLHKNKVIQDLDNYDEKLLEAFISNETLKNNFTIDIAGNIVLQTNKLIELFEADEYWQDSYTKYSKKIGLTASGKFIDESTDVVLDFPYKDTVLKASMSKEDTDRDDLRPDEPFLNEVIAKEEIDVLLDKKILVNAKKYDENGEHEVNHFSEDDNLIIKGNNLLALHTLKEKYAGKVKLIYIDPPFNTGNDSFKYNDQFNRSTWLTFIANRLEIAKELLDDTGLIWINLDDNEAHYCKVLADQIFEEDNFISDVIWQSRKSVSNDALISSNTNHLICYAKNRESIKREDFRLPLDEENYSLFDEEVGEHYRIAPFDAPEVRRNLEYEIVNPNTNEVFLPPNGRHWITTEDEYNNLLARNKIRFGASGEARPQLKVFLSEDKKRGAGKTPTTLWNDLTTTTNATQALRKMNLNANFNNPKPEELIQRIMQLSTNENEIVLDFFMGSATTQAVAHKMNRRYIGIEQMDYINTVSVPRLQKVIEGEQGGISEDVNWQGGGSFVYVELMEKNRGFLKSIRDAKTQTDLQDVFEFMLEEAEIDFRVDLEKVKDTLHELSLDDQKKTLIKIIDKNQLYYNYSEIDDENVRDLISDNDYNFNKNFYDEGGE